MNKLQLFARGRIRWGARAAAYAVLGLPALLSIYGCNRDVMHVDLTSASVEPKVVPTPAVATPSEFKLHFAAQGDNMYVALDLVSKDGVEASDGSLVYRVQCFNNECQQAAGYVACTSSLNQQDPSLRDIDCHDTVSKKIVTRAPGVYQVRFYAYSMQGGYSAVADSDEILVPFEIK